MYTSEEIIFVVLYLIVYFFMMAYGIFTYIGMSLGGFRMGRKARMSNPWMFWIPGCNIYALGNLADTSCALLECKATSHRRKLLTWFIINMVTVSIWAILFVVVGMLSTLIEQAEQGDLVTTPEFGDDALVAPVLILLLLTGVLIALCTVYMVFYYIALHKIYKLYAPSGAAGLTVLSILVSVAIPVIFLVLSGRAPAVAVESDDTTPPPAGPVAPTDMGQSFYSL